MIHNTFLIRTGSKEVLASTQYWPVEVDHEALLEFVSTRDEIKNGQDDYTELPLVIDDHKFHGLDWVGDTILVFVTDKGEEEGNIFEKMRDATTALRKELAKSGLEQVIEKYEQIIEPSVTTRLKIALVGEGGVGKTTTLHLLLGDTPPLQYVPTIALNLETVENIRFGNYSLVLWDFAGQERFRNLWKFYFHGADVIFLVCDSTLRNVIISKDILKMIKRDAPKVPVFAMANKQDKPNAMKPEVVQKILGIPTYPMVAIDKARRDEMLRILMTAAAQYVGVALPDLPASELLKFTDAATEEAIAEVEAAAAEARAEETEEEEFEFVEIVEEVYVDDEGHEIELSDEYEIVEETVEEVEEGEAEEPLPETLTEEVAEVSAESEEPVLPTVEEEIVEVPPEATPVSTSTDEVPSDVESSQPSPAFDLPTTGGEELPPIEVEVLDDEVIGPSEPEEFTVPVNEGPAPVIEGGTDNGTQMAREIIFEALEADDIIVAEIEKASREEIDGALEAFACDEVIPRADDPPLSDTIDQDSLDELESILGPLDKSVGGLGASSEDEDQDYLPIDNETLAELSRLLDLQSDDDEE